MTYTVDTIEHDGEITYDEPANSWSIRATFPAGLLAEVKSVIVLPETTLDQWSAMGDMTRDVEVFTGGRSGEPPARSIR